MRIDYHMHLERGNLSLEYLEEFWRTAQKRNLDEIGISEHGHNFKQCHPIQGHLESAENVDPQISDWLRGSFVWDLQDYVDLIGRAKEKGWRIKLGIEMDYIIGKEAEIAKVLDAYPWDYVLGSVHFLGSWGFDFSPEVGWPGRDVNAAYEEYFKTLIMAIESGLFDSITHPDVIKVFGHRANMELDYLYGLTSEALAKAGCCVEINAAGMRKPVQELYPDPVLLKKCNERGVPITFACDAHIPEDVGNGLDEAIKLAKSCGYTEVAMFDRRRRTLHELG